MPKPSADPLDKAHVVLYNNMRYSIAGMERPPPAILNPDRSAGLSAWLTRMSKKPTTTKEEMIEGALSLIREQGHEALTARNIAAFLGCSTQPIMYRFPNMDTLRELTYQRADAYHTAYILAGEDLLDIGLRYIRFAEEEPRLFAFLFQSGRFSGLSLEDLIRAPESAALLAAVRAEESITAEDAAAFFEPLVALVHGYASLIANNAMKYDPQSTREVLIAVAEGLERRNAK